MVVHGQSIKTTNARNKEMDHRLSYKIRSMVQSMPIPNGDSAGAKMGLQFEVSFITHWKWSRNVRIRVTK